MRGSLTLMMITGLMSAGMLSPGAASAATELHYRVVQTYPHSTQAFTEGLAICNGDLVESDGLYGKSRIEIRSLHMGQVLASRALPADQFGEGVTCADGRLLQLTWRAGLAYAYDHALNPLGRYDYSGEGWGLAYDGKRLIESDGSDTLRFFRPSDFAPLGALKVHDGHGPVTQLNELEWANGLIYANVWHQNRIAVIDPDSGAVTAWIDCTALAGQLVRTANWDSEDVLNGIAYDPDSGHFFLTGKNWPKLFEIALQPAPGSVPAQAGRALPQ